MSLIYYFLIIFGYLFIVCYFFIACWVSTVFCFFWVLIYASCNSSVTQCFTKNVNRDDKSNQLTPLRFLLIDIVLAWLVYSLSLSLQHTSQCSHVYILQIISLPQFKTNLLHLINALSVLLLNTITWVATVSWVFQLLVKKCMIKNDIL